MKNNGLDFKHKEVINVSDGRRLGFVQDVKAELGSGIITSIVVPGSSNFLTFLVVIILWLFLGLLLNVLVMMLFWLSCNFYFHIRLICAIALFF